MQIFYTTFILVVFLLTSACSVPLDTQEKNKMNVAGSETQNSVTSNVKIYIDPVTGKPTAPPAKLGKKPSVGFINQPVTVYNETIMSDGSAILEPTFNPVNYLKVSENCAGGLEVFHGKSGKGSEKKCHDEH